MAKKKTKTTESKVDVVNESKKKVSDEIEKNPDKIKIETSKEKGKKKFVIKSEDGKPIDFNTAMKKLFSSKV